MANPFQYDKPLSGKEGFFNRTSEIMRITSRIAAERPQSVSIVGELKVGKTSLLNRFCAPETKLDLLGTPDQYVFLYLNLSLDPPDRPETFFTHLGQAWQQQGGAEIAPTFDGFSDMVKELMQAGRKLLLFLDDFGVITQNEGFPLGFFSFMRSVANSSDVGYVTTSSRDLQKLCHTQDIEESPFFNIFTTVHLELFKEKDARQLVEESVAGEREPWGEGIDPILELAGGSPYLLQLTGNLAYETGSQGKLDRGELADAAFKQAKGFLERLWDDHLSPVEQEVLRSLVDGKKVERRQEYAAESLVRRGHLSQAEDTYQLRSELLSRFVRERGGGFWKRLFG